MFDDDRKVAVIGAGIFGCTTAIALADRGYEVVLLDRLPEILSGTTGNNTNRVHQGFHYPRDLTTARMCRDNFKRFLVSCSEAVLKGFPNLYCIASEGSVTSAEDYLRFCESLELSYTRVDFRECATEIRDCALGLSCEEAVCDADILRELLAARTQERRKITVVCGADVLGVERSGGRYQLTTQTRSKLTARAVVNCSYSDINRLTIQLGHPVGALQFEYTVVPVVKVDLPPQGITVMDGPFMTLLPYGRKPGKFTLYHVRDSVIETDVASTVNREWLCRDTSPFSRVDKSEFFRRMRADCAAFVPALRNAELVGFLEGPRMVLANHDGDDARPSLLQNYGGGYFTVFSGKIDHFFSIAEWVCKAMDEYLGGSEKTGRLADLEDRARVGEG